MELDQENMDLVEEISFKVINDLQNIWIEPKKGIALGHRRLSIIELSAAGAQPMESQGGKYLISFNGEIYNHKSLRLELQKK